VHDGPAEAHFLAGFGRGMEWVVVAVQSRFFVWFLLAQQATVEQQSNNCLGAGERRTGINAHSRPSIESR
jgi:hypothetical protein